MSADSNLSTFEIFAGLWRTDGGFDSTLRIRNELVVTPMDVAPILYMADGTEYELPPARIAAGGSAVVDINRALAAAPGVIAAHRSPFGSVALRYQYTTGGHIVGSIQMLNAAQSLIFVTPFNGVDDTDIGLQTLEGLWWRRDPGVGGYVSLANVTETPETVTVEPVDGRGALGRVRRYTLAAHATEVHNLQEIVGSAAPSTAGGLRVTYGGPMGGVIVTGGLVNEREGYSAGIPFYFHDTSAAAPVPINYGSAGVMTGAPDPVMGFPQGVTFTPYAALRNTSDVPLAITLSLAWMTHDGTPMTDEVPELTLGRRESRQVDMRAVLAEAGLANFNGTVNLGVSFTGRAGDLVLATGSVDSSGTFVFEVEPQGIAKTNSKQVQYWAARPDGTDTMYSLWNPTDSAQDIVLTLLAGDGSGTYKLPLHLSAHASTTIDVGALIKAQRPDADGHVISASVTEGSAIVDSAAGRRTPVTLVVSGGAFNVRTGTCGSTCINCCGYSFGVTPGDFAIDVGDTMACAMQGTDCNGGQLLFDSNWTSSDSSVMSVDGSGNVTGIGAGSATITGTTVANNIDVYTGQICTSNGNPSCPTAQPSAQTPGTTRANVQIASTSPASTSINLRSAPTAATLTVQIYHQNVAQAQTLDLEAATAFGNPQGTQLSYSPQSQGITINAGDPSPVTRSVQVTAACNCAGQVTAQMSLSNASSGLNVLAASPATNAQSVVTITNQNLLSLLAGPELRAVRRGL